MIRPIDERTDAPVRLADADASLASLLADAEAGFGRGSGEAAEAAAWRRLRDGLHARRRREIAWAAGLTLVGAAAAFAVTWRWAAPAPRSAGALRESVLAAGTA